MKPGDVVARRYRLEQKLGEGGMGAVWSATHVNTGHRRALKFLRKDAADGARRALREARAAASVAHASVVTVHDVIDDDDGNPVLVMDRLEGESLGDVLRRQGRLPPARAVALVTQILEALVAIHAVGVVHRDLKPDNVFLVDDGARVVLLDFGIAKLTAGDGPAQATSALTASSAMLGTPCYMAPEQAFGEPDIDARADLWAVGVLLYEAIAGVRPVDGGSLGQTFKVLATGGITPLEARVPETPPEVARFVAELLTLDRAGRPSSASAALERLRDGFVSTSPNVNPGMRRRVVFGGFALLAVGALVTAGLAKTSGPAPKIAAAPVPWSTRFSMPRAPEPVVTPAIVADRTPSAAPPADRRIPARTSVREAPPPPSASADALGPSKLLTRPPY